MRVVPFTTALASGLEKVRAALGASAQRQLLVGCARNVHHGQNRPERAVMTTPNLSSFI